MLMETRADRTGVMRRLGMPKDVRPIAIGPDWRPSHGELLVVRSPIDGLQLAQFRAAAAEDVGDVVAAASEAFLKFRVIPAPQRGELVRRIGVKLREHKEDLASLVTWETGKILQEALGEVQEMIDICDYAVGLSRQLYGLTIASERPNHRLSEQWHPLGAVGVITAFNFPVAVWAWNAMLALVCGDSIVWKPSEKTPLTAMACHSLVNQVLDEMPEIPAAVVTLIVGSGAQVGQSLAADVRLPLISATGSVRMGREVAGTVARRLGRTLLELGGNNGLILTPSADLELAERAIAFAAVGTCGQRCTTLRRLIIHDGLYDDMLGRLQKIYGQLPIGNPLDGGVLVGPIIDSDAADTMDRALEQAKREGGRVHGGGRVTTGVPDGGVYVRPAIVEIDSSAAIVAEETFAPILYVLRYRTFEEAIAIHNAVPQGLASAIFTSDVREAERFCSAAGSDCGIANVNIGTSGAEIGGAFGGEKDTGGGRESGSDAWRFYMRRMTSTVNYGTDLPLAQGIKFDF